VSRDAPLLAERLVDAINSDRQIEVHVWGSMGQSDMTMEVVGLCKPIAGVELMVAAQATPLGAVTGKLFAFGARGRPLRRGQRSRPPSRSAAAARRSPVR
jgi:hypothetical protein